MPGGRLEPAESIATCAIREAAEETGYEIKTNEKVGQYSRPKFNDIQHVFLGEIIGVEVITDAEETKQVKWYRLSVLPFLWCHIEKVRLEII